MNVLNDWIHQSDLILHYSINLIGILVNDSELLEHKVVHTSMYLELVFEIARSEMKNEYVKWQ